jgi:hypothetical protein
MLSGFQYGDCLITVATPSLTDEEELRAGLVSGHAYAVLHVWEGKAFEKLIIP